MQKTSQLCNRRDWKSETGRYRSRLNTVLALLKTPPHYPWLPKPPLSNPPNELQCLLYIATSFYSEGVWFRAKETVIAITILWKEGCLSPVESMVRIIFELWAVCHYQTIVINKFCKSHDIGAFKRHTIRLSRGNGVAEKTVRGTPATEKPINIHTCLKVLEHKLPDTKKIYADLSESAHANQLRFLRWGRIGLLADNWNNDVVFQSGHELLEKTVTYLEFMIPGLIEDAKCGIEQCRVLYTDDRFSS